MKIAVIHSYYSSAQPSGENIVVDAQVGALRESGIDVEVIAARTDELEPKRGYKVRSAVNVATGIGPRPLLRLRAFDPDVVHVHNLFPNWGTRWLDQWPGPIVATVHNFRPMCAAGTLYRDGQACTLCPDHGSHNALKYSCYRSSRVATLPLAIRSRGGAAKDTLLCRADRIIALSARARGIYVHAGIPADRITVIPNFVEDVGFNPHAPIGNEWVYIGRLTQEKGIAGLVENWPKGHKLKIYGDGPLRQQVQNASSHNADIRYVGPIPRAQVPAALAGSMGLIFPSEWAEGFPTTYVEALAAGRPVVARRGNSAADDVSESAAGVVFDAWHQLEQALSSTEAQALRLGTIANAHYMTSFTRDTWLSRMLSIYSSVITASRNHAMRARPHESH